MADFQREYCIGSIGSEFGGHCIHSSPQTVPSTTDVWARLVNLASAAEAIFALHVSRFFQFCCIYGQIFATNHAFAALSFRYQREIHVWIWHGLHIRALLGRNRHEKNGEIPEAVSGRSAHLAWKKRNGRYAKFNTWTYECHTFFAFSRRKMTVYSSNVAE